MPKPTPIPAAFHGHVFTVQEAASYGFSRRALQGKRFKLVEPGVYRLAATKLTLGLTVQAALRNLPSRTFLSHVSNLQWRGLNIGTASPLHFATNARLHVERDGLAMHRFQGQLYACEVQGLLVLGPDRTFVDSATMLSIEELIRVGDWLIAQGHTTRDQLLEYVLSSHLDGVQRAREAVECVRTGSESVKETDLRLILRRFGLTEPLLNWDIHDHTGRFIARGDLVYEQFKVLVEYDGWQHERDAHQRQRDHLRRERLEAEGWRVVIVTAIDLRDPRNVARRVHAALSQRGYSKRFGG